MSATHRIETPDHPTQWIETASGGRYYFERPDLSAVTLTDIAASLSKLCRFNGHCRRFYSVAEHSIHVSREIERAGFRPAVQMAALMHDAHEAYLGDVATPLKAYFGAYERLAAAADRAIAAALGLPLIDNAAVRAIKAHDLNVLVAETAALMPTGGRGWHWPLAIVHPASIRIEGLGPLAGEARFLDRFAQLRRLLDEASAASAAG